jgi:predicted GNAT family acetyltransferase
MTEDVLNNTAMHRFELEAEGHIAAAYYDLKPGIVIFTHTEVPKELAGKGIGSRLVKGALNQVRNDNLKIIANCPFVKAYIEKHPEQADLLAEG